MTKDIVSIKDSERGAFLSLSTIAELVTQLDSEGWPFAVIDDQEYAIVTSDFEMFVVQNGHAGEDPKFLGHAGEIYVSGMELFSAERTLLPISIVSHGFRMYTKYEGPQKEAQLLCYSSNGVTPAARVEAPMNSCCSEIEVVGGVERRKVVCPHALWTDDNKPACQQVITLAFLDITDPATPIPVRTQFKGTGLGAWNAFSREYGRIRNVAKLKRQSVSDYALKMTVNNKGTYCTPVFTMYYDETRPSRYIPLLAYYREQFYMREPQEQSAQVTEQDKAGAVEVPISVETDGGGATEFTL